LFFRPRTRIELARHSGGWRQSPLAEESKMKLAAQVLMLAATAGLALFAVGTRKSTEETNKQESAPATAPTEADAWFI
jgi:hypothetical protein